MLQLEEKRRRDIEQSAASVDNRRRINCRSTKEEQQQELNANSSEKERQKNGRWWLEMFATSWLHNVATRIQLAKSLIIVKGVRVRPIRHCLTTNEIAHEMASLEKNLKSCKVMNVVATATWSISTMESVAASSSDATITSSSHSYNDSAAVDSSVVEDVICRSDNDDDDAAVVVATTNIIPTTDKVHGSNNNGCIECNIPSYHSCRECRKCVCLWCCAEKRALDNAWWCDVCFKTQSVANKQLICDGNYSSGDEEW